MPPKVAKKHHLMRVRIRKTIFDRLQEVASAQTDITGEHVPVSDLVRIACVHYLHVYDQLEQIQAMPQLAAEMQERFAEGDVLIVPLPALTFGR